MKGLLIIIMLVIQYGLLPNSVFSQNSSEPGTASKYDHHSLFSPLFYHAQGNTYRSATGMPGPDYWQNNTDYRINVTLDTLNNEIAGTVTIRYTNNSPQELTYLWLQLDQNAFQKDSRSLATKHFFRDTSLATNPDSYGSYADVQNQKLKEKMIESLKYDHGYKIKTVNVVSDKGKKERADYIISDTRMKVMVGNPVAPSGGKINIEISYSYIIPEYFTVGIQNRTDILHTSKGKLYSIAQWYPRVCVLDDVDGWNTLPYLGRGEFYLEYGDYDVNLTVPSSYIIVASGELINPSEVLTPTEYARWQEARKSDKKVFIRTVKDVNDPNFRTGPGNRTWRFTIKNARDFAWATSAAFIWEGFRINVPNGNKVFGMTVYPPESAIDSLWGRASEYEKFSIENFSKRWYAYPYPCVVTVAAKADGMEYPGIVFCNSNALGMNYTWGLINHELAHTWFPMIVGSNERKHAWMDEGFVMFIADISSQDLNNKDLPGHKVYQLPGAEYFADSLAPIISLPDASENEDIWKVQYLKMAYVMGFLRNHIVGPERFDPAFRKYIHDWAFKHPTPWDFFRSIENSVGENLGWFWKSMFFESYKLDQSISSVEFDRNDAGRGTEIVIDNLEKAAMPLIIEVVTKSGKRSEIKLPVEIWIAGSRYKLIIPGEEEIQQVQIDPDSIYPDTNRKNNIWHKSQ